MSRSFRLFLAFAMAIGVSAAGTTAFAQCSSGTQLAATCGELSYEG